MANLLKITPQFLFFFFRVCGLFLPELGSFVAGMLFGVQPIHTEAVSSFLQIMTRILFLLSLTQWHMRRSFPRIKVMRSELDKLKEKQLGAVYI
jgi:hypothetical protein